MTILYVDDDALMREVIQLGFRRAGLQVIAADGGHAALAVLECGEIPITVVLTDLSMPVMDGVQLAAAVKRRWPELPVVAFSGDPQRHLRRPADGQCFAAVVRKGATSQQLLAVVRAAAAGAAQSLSEPADHQFAGLEPVCDQLAVRSVDGQLRN
jgi:CheY-like chemotaxis protein